MEYPGEKIRLFIGVEILPEISQEVGALRLNLKQAEWLSWTKPENLHITVFFLGDVRIEMLENLISLFRLGYLSCKPITLLPGKWVWAPNGKDSRMIWIRFPKSEEFSELVRESQDWFTQIQSSPQQRLRPFPHITVARFRPDERSPVDLPEGQINGRLNIRSLKLWRADTSEAGVSYTPLATFRLGRK